MNNSKNSKYKSKFKNFKTIFLFELNGFIKVKKNWVLVYIVIALSLLLILSPFIASIFSNSDENSDTIYMYFQDVQVPIENTNNDNYYIVQSAEELDDLLHNDVREFYLINNDNITLYTLDNFSFISQPNTKSFSNFISSLYINSFLANNGLLEQYQAIYDYVNNIDVTPIELTDNGYSIVDTNNDVNSDADLGIRYFTGFIFVMIFYITMMQFGGYAATSVANEKSSRTMESLIYTTDTDSLIYGKVFGIFIGSMIQILIICLLLFGSGFIALKIAIAQDLFSQSAITIIIDVITNVINFNFIVLFLALYSLGFLMTLFIFASLSSTITKIEELSSTIAMGTFISLATYMIGIFTLMAPSNRLLMVLSYVPIFTPLSMFARFTMGSTTTFDIAYALIGSTITVVIIGLFAAKLYKIAVLLYGTKPTNRQLLKAIFSKN